MTIITHTNLSQGDDDDDDDDAMTVMMEYNCYKFFHSTYSFTLARAFVLF